MTFSLNQMLAKVQKKAPQKARGRNSYTDRCIVKTALKKRIGETVKGRNSKGSSIVLANETAHF